MRRAGVTLAAALIGAAALLGASAARADGLGAWPVRLNLALPVGYTFGSDRFGGFTWGLRGSVDVYPRRDGRGTSVGAYAEVLVDARTETLWTLGGAVTTPTIAGEVAELRAGGMAGWTTRPGRGGGPGLTVGALSYGSIPAYLYDFRLGLRVGVVFDERGLGPTSVLADLDLVGLIGLYGWAQGG